MAYDAKAVEIMIASPSDVAQERQIVREVVAEWNAVHSRARAVVLMPVSWETHSAPELSGRPQQMINDRVLAHADLLVGIFWARVGTPTGKAISGSIEEIEEHRRHGKPVMLYFSNAPVVPDSIDQSQYEQLKKFKKWATGEGIVWSYEDREDFRSIFRHQLQLTLRDNPYLRGFFAENADTDVEPNLSRAALVAPLSGDALELLRVAATDDQDQGTILILRGADGAHVQAGHQNFGEWGDRRSAARWQAAVGELRSQGLVERRGGTSGVDVFEITHAGYRLLEM
jgi:hypothetical protein